VGAEQMEEAGEDEDQQGGVGHEGLRQRDDDGGVGRDAAAREEVHAHGEAGQASGRQHVVDRVGDEGDLQHLAEGDGAARGERDALVGFRHRQIARQHAEHGQGEQREARPTERPPQLGEIGEEEEHDQRESADDERPADPARMALEGGRYGHVSGGAASRVWSIVAHVDLALLVAPHGVKRAVKRAVRKGFPLHRA
jgi:hypothetical protein